MLRPRSASGKVLAGLAASVAALMLAGYALALRPDGADAPPTIWAMAGGSGALVLMGLMLWAAAAVQVWRRGRS